MPTNGTIEKQGLSNKRSSGHQRVGSGNSNNDEEENENNKKRQQRRCCGLPPWAFVLLTILILAAILVAILVPIFEVKANQKNKPNSNENNCKQSNPCSNGGISVSSGSLCSCICSGGFTGIQCTTPGDDNCITTKLTGDEDYNNVTVGNTLPNLFSSSNSQYGISLDKVTIMALFSQMNATCSLENLLVAMNGNKMANFGDENEDIEIGNEINVDEMTTTKNTISAPPSLNKLKSQRQDHIHKHNDHEHDHDHDNDNENENNQQENPPKPKPNIYTRNNNNNKALNFGQIAILFIFEKTGIFAAAQDAENRIHSFLSQGTTTSGTLHLSRYNIAGNEFVLDFGKFSITMPNGQVSGGNH